MVESSTSSSWFWACWRVASLWASCSPMVAAAVAIWSSSAMSDCARVGLQWPWPIRAIMAVTPSIGCCSWWLSWRERSHMAAKNSR
ncbi:hypothetical protein D3C84_1136330 [compost metagenome]